MVGRAIGFPRQEVYVRLQDVFVYSLAAPGLLGSYHHHLPPLLLFSANPFLGLQPAGGTVVCIPPPRPLKLHWLGFTSLLLP